MIKTDDDLKTLPPDIRECYFEREKELKYFRNYTQKNCEIECFMNLTMAECGCVDLYQPFQSIDDVCLSVNKTFLDYCPNRVISDLQLSEEFSIERNCSCLPMCNSLSYDVKYFVEYLSLNGSNETSITVRMNMDGIGLYRRYQQFSLSDVVSFVGGLLGLFAGISMLSIVEFFYFFTIRIGFDLWKRLGNREISQRNWVDGMD